MMLRTVALICALFVISSTSAADKLHHYVFFNLDRERITDPSFLDTPALEGAQIKYTWRQLEQRKGEYDFEMIHHDLSFLSSHGKMLFIQIQDVSFDAAIVPLPKYLFDDPQYHGGANQQYDIPHDDEHQATPAGWVSRRWDAVVRDRFQKLLAALGKEFDGKIEGINLPETALDFGESGWLFPDGYTADSYREAVVSNMSALKQAFPKSVAMQYANFITERPGDSENSNLRALYVKAVELNVAMGGPDLLPWKPGQMWNSYPLIREHAGRVKMGIAVQDGNYAHKNPKTGQRVTIPELIDFAGDYLHVDYVFWCTQEPYYSDDVLPYLRK